MGSDVTIIGAGVIGLAVASEISEIFRNVFVLEKHKIFGQETSSRNSEVIHAGIYYAKNSLKSKLCVEGNKLLYEVCEKNSIPYKKCGKLIVATNEAEVRELERLMTKAKVNGVDVKYVSGEELRKLEPNVKAVKAIYSPSTGIIDSYSLMKHLESMAKNNGAELAYGVKVVGVEKIAKQGYKVNIIDSDGQPFSYNTKYLINCAGLESDKIAESIGIDIGLNNYKIYFWKGEYFNVCGGKGKMIDRLVYPVPPADNVGLGVHATIDLTGGLRLGPNAKYLVDKVYDYSVDSSEQQAFFESASKFLPFIEYENLSPEMAGIRPKLQKPGDNERDFIISEECERGFPGVINLIGIESPGLTSCISIAKYVKELLTKT